MSAESTGDAKDVFLAAIEIESPEAREAYLVEACGGDESFRRRVEALIVAHERPESLLDHAAPELSEHAQAEATLDLSNGKRPGCQIGPYKLLQELGQGGMGVVYMAEQSEPVKRRVALKIIKPGMDSRQVIARFEAERQALAMMDHPNIAKVLDAGTTEAGRPYFVMELIKGTPLTRYCDEHRLTLDDRLELFVIVCNAVHHAHQKGIIHRDIKPTNVLVAEYDDHPVPKVIDFGVAKAVDHRLTEKTMFTEYGQIVGTFEYMSPEQARLNQLDIDTRSDIYSLGVLLYELLTGETPFDRKRLASAAYDELLRIIREEEPPRPSARLSTSHATSAIAANRHTEPKKLSTLVRGELDWIVMKALDKERSRRYETAVGLADDIRRYLHDETVVACPPSSAYRLGKFAKRNKTVLSVGLFILTALVLGAVTTTWQAIVAWKAQQEAIANFTTAQRHRQIAEDAERNAVTANVQLRDALSDLKQQNYFNAINLAYHAWNSGNRDRLEQLLDEMKSAEHAQNVRGFEWQYLAARQQELHSVPEISTPDTVVTIAFSPDGKYLVVACIDGTVLVRDMQQGVLIPVPEQLKGAYVAFSARGSYLAAGDGEHGLRVWTFPDFQQVGQAGEDRVNIYAVAFSNDENLLAIGRTDGNIEIRSVLNGEVVWQPKDSPQPGIFGMRLAFDPDGRYLAGAWKEAVKVWDVRSRMEIGAFEDPAGFGVLAFSPNGKTLVAGGEFGMESWEVTDDGLRGPSQPKIQLAATCASFSLDGNLLAIGCSNFRVTIVSNDGFREIARLLQRDHVNCVGFSSDGKTVAAGGRENVVRLWNVDRWRSDVGHQIVRNFAPPFAVSSDGRIATVREDEGRGRHILEVWNPANGESSIVPERADLEVSAVAFAPDTSVLAVATDNGVIHLWSMHPLVAIRTWTAHMGSGSQEFGVAGNRITCLAFSPDGRTLVSGGDFPDLAVWDLSGSDCDEAPPVRKLKDADGAVSSVAFSADGLLAAAGSTKYRRGETDIWCCRDREPVHLKTLSHPEWVRCVAFSPDGKYMALQHDFSAGVIDVYDVKTWQVWREFQGHSSKSVGLAFTPDGQRLATGSDDGTIRFWNIASNEPVGTLETHERIRRLAFLSDATTLVSVSWEGWIRLWRASPAW